MKVFIMVSDRKWLAIITSVFKTTIANAFFITPFISQFWYFLPRPLDP